MSTQRDFHLLAAAALLLCLWLLALNVPQIAALSAALGVPGVEYVRRSTRRQGRQEAEPMPIHHLIECAGR